jgi:DNA-binding CsgD family transcriptional regulator
MNTGFSSPIPAAPQVVGRAQQLATLDELRSDHLNGRGRLLSIDGAPGMGKTTLLAAHAQRSIDAGIRVLWAKATEIDQIRPFGCLLDALDCRLNSPDAARRRVANAARASGDTEIDPFRFDIDSVWRFPVQEAIVDLLLDQLDHERVLLAIDDAQWADSASLGVVMALARRCRGSGLVIGWTLRSSFNNDAIEQIIARQREDVVSVSLGPLAVSHAHELGSILAGHELDNDSAKRLSQAGGNPLLIAALVNTESDAGPTNDAVLGWIRRMPEATTDLLGVAAIFGGAFDTRTLAAMTDRQAADLIAGLEPAVLSGLVVTSGSGRYTFFHDLIRSALYDDLPSTLRSALHRDAAKVLRRSGADPGVVAHHLGHGARPGDEEAAEQIRVACAQVVRHDATSASDLLGRAVTLCAPGSPTWAATVSDHVTALQWAGRAAEALALSTEAMSYSMSKAEMAKVRLSRATSLGLLGDLPGSAEEYRVLAYDDEVDATIRAQVLAELCTLEAWGLDRERGRVRADEALDLARRVGVLQAELQTLCALSTIELFDGDVRLAVSYAREAVTLGRSFRGLAPARELYLGLALGQADELDEAAIWLRSGQSAADKVTDLWLVSRYQLARTAIALHTGQWDEALAECEAVISLHEDTGIMSGMPQAPATAGLITLRRNLPLENVARYRDLAGRSASSGAEPAGLIYYGWLEALIAEREGRHVEAAGTLSYIYDTVATSAPLVQMWLAPDLIRIALSADNVARASAVQTSMSAFAAHVGVASAFGTARWCECLVAQRGGDLSAARELALAAAEQFRQAGRAAQLYEVLETLSVLDPQTASGAEQRQLASRLGISVHSAESKAEAGQTRSPAQGSSSSVSRSFQLTPAELTVVELVAQGLTNPVIALRLGVSKRTVEYHLSNLYAKFGVNTRVALASMLSVKTP